jgi:hypothetical protein
MRSSTRPRETSVSKDPEYKVGYKKPPKETRFKKGQSGNSKGRPTGAKGRALQEIIEQELNSKITVNMGTRQQKITISEAMTKAQIQKALKGDHKSFALLAKGLESRESSQKENLPPILEALRNIHAKHEAEEGNFFRTIEIERSTKDEEGSDGVRA